MDYLLSLIVVLVLLLFLIDQFFINRKSSNGHQTKNYNANINNFNSDNSQLKNLDHEILKDIYLLAQAKGDINSMKYSEEESQGKLDHSRFMQYFLTAPTLADCRRIIDNHPEFMTKESERLMEDMIVWAPENARDIMNDRLDLFRRCCEEGTEVAFQNNFFNKEVVDVYTILKELEENITPENVRKRIEKCNNGLIILKTKKHFHSDDFNKTMATLHFELGNSLLFLAKGLLFLKDRIGIRDIPTQYKNKNLLEESLSEFDKALEYKKTGDLPDWKFNVIFKLREEAELMHKVNIDFQEFNTDIHKRIKQCINGLKICKNELHILQTKQFPLRESNRLKAFLHCELAKGLIYIFKSEQPIIPIEYQKKNLIEEAILEFDKSIEYGKIGNMPDQMLEIIKNLREEAEYLLNANNNIDSDTSKEEKSTFLYNSALMKDRQQLYNEAIILYREAISIYPSNLEARNNYAIIQRKLKNYDEAEEHYKEIIKLDPTFYYAYCNYANLLKEINRTSEAEGMYKKALELCPTYQDAMQNYADLLHKTGRAVEASQNFPKMNQFSEKR